MALNANNIFGKPLSFGTGVTAAPTAMQTPSVATPTTPSAVSPITAGTSSLNGSGVGSSSIIANPVKVQATTAPISTGTPVVKPITQSPTVTVANNNTLTPQVGATPTVSSTPAQGGKLVQATYTPLGGGSAAEQNSSKKITLDAADPDFENKAAAISLQRQQEKAVTDLALQQQASRAQFMQQLADSGQKGSTLATLTMLKDREYNSALNTLNWQMTNNYMDWLSTQQDSYEKDTKAKFAGDIASAMEAGDFDGASRLISAASQLFSDDTYFKALTSPDYFETVAGTYTPQAQERKINALNTVIANLKSAGNVMDPDTLDGNVSSALKTLRSGYNQKELETLASTYPESGVKAFAEKFYPNVQFDGVYPDSLKEDAYLYSQLKGQMGNTQDEYVANVVKGLKLDLSGTGLNQTNVNTVAQAIGDLATADGDITIDGLTIPADYLTNMESGASSIFVTDWDGDTNFNNRTPESNTLDKLWLMAVKDNGGDFTYAGNSAADMRDQFAQNVMTVAAEQGYGDLGSLSASQLKSLYAKAVKPYAGIDGIYRDLTSAMRSGDPLNITTALRNVDYTNDQDKMAVNRMVSSMSEAGKLIDLNGISSGNYKDSWTTTPGVYYASVPLSNGSGQGLVVVTVGEPTYSDGTWKTHISAEDPSGSGLLGDKSDYSFEMTESEYKDSPSSGGGASWARKFDKYTGGNRNPVTWAKNHTLGLSPI